MKVENSKYVRLEHKKINFHFGNFYFFNDFIIGELNEGIHFDLVKILQVVDKINNYYGENFKLVYIANRINSYSTDPQSWPKLQAIGHNFIVATALVSYNDIGFKVAAVEKQISKTYLKRYNNLNDAIIWAFEFSTLEKNNNSIR